MEHKLEQLMGLYNEALEELMGAQKYAKCAHKADDPHTKTMYRDMAKQELEHAHLLMDAGGRTVAGQDAMLGIVWAHLKQHLIDWRSDIEQKLNK